ncbi:MAG: hypothetical protein ACXWN4_03890, partial [Candidatus Limnocylindrales bacterium]
MRPLDVRIEAALRAYDQDCRWDLIDGIVELCPDDVVEASQGLLRGVSESERTLGADILGRLISVE